VRFPDRSARLPWVRAASATFGHGCSARPWSSP
jgi:hypothetical protein